MKEEAVLFGESNSLVGIVTLPEDAKRDLELPAFVLLNAGMIHRVGPNRHYVDIARKLAAMGFVALRFDFSGLGDSVIGSNNLTIDESTLLETQEAMSYLGATRGVKRFVLVGLCSGATTSLNVACREPRVEGVVLINPEGYTTELASFVTGRIRSRRYWKRALFDPRRWLKAVTGRFDYRVMAAQAISLFSNKKRVSSDASKVAADFRLLVERQVRMLIVYSGGDPGLEFQDLILGDQVHELVSSGKLTTEIIPYSDHIFTLLDRGEELLRVIRNWASAEMIPSLSTGGSH